MIAGTPPPTSASPGSRWRIVAPVLIALLAIAFSVHRMEDFDTWYHLAAGRLMMATGRWPATNTFSLTAPDYPWIDLHWIFQLVLYAAWSLAGMNGVVLLAAALVTTTALVLYALARRFVPPALAAFVLALALTISSPRFVPRPELLSFVYFAIYLVILEGHPRNGRAIFWLVPLQILWANTQGIFAVGIALIGCWWLGATLAFLPFVPRGWRAASGLGAPDWRRLTVVLALATAACLVNPWGIEGALFPLQLLPRVTGNSLFSSRIGEFRAPLRAGYAMPLMYTWFALLLAAGASFLLAPRRWHLGRLLAVVAFGALSTQSLRNMAFFGWVAVPAIAANVGPWVGRVPARLRAVLAGAALVAIAGLTGSVVTNHFSRFLGTQREFGLGVSRARFSDEAVAFLERAGISGRAFNCLAMGGYLTWMRPHDRVFVDGRLEAFPEQVFRQYFQAMEQPAAWPQAVGSYPLDYALLYHGWSNRLPLAAYLSTEHGWTLVYYDEIASIFVPSDDAHAAMRDRALRAFFDVRTERRKQPDPALPTALERALAVPVGEVFRLRSYGSMLRNLGFPAEAVRPLERALVLDPDSSDTRFAIGFAYWAANRRPDALAAWRELLRRDPANEQVKQVLAQAEAQK